MGGSAGGAAAREGALCSLPADGRVSGLLLPVVYFCFVQSDTFPQRGHRVPDSPDAQDFARPADPAAGPTDPAVAAHRPPDSDLTLPDVAPATDRDAVGTAARVGSLHTGAESLPPGGWRMRMARRGKGTLLDTRG